MEPTQAQAASTQKKTPAPTRVNKTKPAKESISTSVADAPLSMEEIQVLIRQHPRAWFVWLDGYQAGLIQGTSEGANSQRITQTQAMDQIAQRIEANRLLNDDVRTVMRSTISGFDVQKHRAEMCQPQRTGYTGGPVDWETGKPLRQERRAA